MIKPSIFIASSSEGTKAAKALGKELEPDAFVTVWTELVFLPEKPIIETLFEVAEQFDFVVFMFSPDDLVMPRGINAPRANLLFELGFLIGRMGRSRIFLVTEKSPTLRIPSDLLSVGITHYEISSTTNVIASLSPVAELIKKAIVTLGIRSDRPVDYYSCFISYSSQDKEFAHKLHNDLQKVGVRCWLDIKDLKIGERLVDQINRAISVHDKVLLVLSEASINSSWVKHEIENAFKLEDSRKRTILFPIRIDNAVLETTNNPALNLVKDKFIGDFSDWKNQNSYEVEFRHLVRDLLVSTSVDIGGQS